jgi:hypothetical protein
MKMTHQTSLALLVVLACASALPAVGCSGPTKMTASPSTPFTEGEVDASYKMNGNGSVTVRVKNLGDPAKLNKAATTYVVWLTPEGSNAAQNAGALKVDGSMEGELEFKTPFKKFNITVTPEPSADVTAKSGNAVLTADVVAN